MRKFDTRVQMMDAGMKLFESENGFGTCIGQVKANLKETGKVLEARELEGIALPGSTGDFDLFVDRSNLRKKYLSCRIEYAGEREDGGKTIFRYAASFREGNRSRGLRAVTMLVLMLLSAAAAVVFNSFISYLAGFAAIVAIACLWIMPSGEAVRTVRRLMSEL